MTTVKNSTLSVEAGNVCHDANYMLPFYSYVVGGDLISSKEGSLCKVTHMKPRMHATLDCGIILVNRNWPDLKQRM